MKKVYNRFLWHLKELNKTLSNEPSYYSSKRLERLVLFISANISVDVYTFKNIDKMSTSDILLIFGAKMVYAGFQVKQIQKENKQDETKL